MKEFDLSQRAANGLRRGYTTGTCATAGVKAALCCLFHDDKPAEVAVTLPDELGFLRVPIASVRTAEGGGAVAKVVKFAGDDPDQTDGATLVVEVRPEDDPGVRFEAGKGVGVVRQAGLQIGVGEAAINPVPQAMMRRAIREMCADFEPTPVGFCVRVGCERGAEIARRTFNPRLGIEGGISILGTTGIVEPKSLASFKAAIEIYINVALADDSREVVFSPGNLGQRFARSSLEVELRQVVQISNFAGFSLDHLVARLREKGRSLRRLWVVGHPGKLAKLIDGHWDTHSKSSPTAVGTIARVAGELDISLGDANTVEQIAKEHGECGELWNELAARIRDQVSARVKDSVDEVAVRLFSLAGSGLNWFS